MADDENLEEIYRRIEESDKVKLQEKKRVFGKFWPQEINPRRGVLSDNLDLSREKFPVRSSKKALKELKALLEDNASIESIKVDEDSYQIELDYPELGSTTLVYKGPVEENLSTREEISNSENDLENSQKSIEELAEFLEDQETIEATENGEPLPLSLWLEDTPGREKNKKKSGYDAAVELRNLDESYGATVTSDNYVEHLDLHEFMVKLDKKNMTIRYRGPVEPPEEAETEESSGIQEWKYDPSDFSDQYS